jgi:hypothetical protein
MADPQTLLGNSVSLIREPVTLLPGAPTPTPGGLTPLPQGTGTTLTWQGGTADNDPTVAANWNPAIAPAMAANQTLIMNSGHMELNGGILSANQLNVTAPSTSPGPTIDLTNHGSLDLNIPSGSPHVAVNMAGTTADTGGAIGVLNVFADKSSDPDVTVKIDHSTLDLQANMWFGSLTVDGTNGGTAYLQGDSHLSGTSVILNTPLQGYGSVELGTYGTHTGRMELSAALPQGVTISALDNNGQGGSNGLILDKTSESTTAGGQISLQDAFVKIRDPGITSYTKTGDEYDFYANGTKVDALDIISGPNSGALQVASNAYGVYVYNANPTTMPLGAGNGMGSGPGTGTGGGTGAGSMTLAFQPDALAAATNPLTPLPLHA